MKTSGNTPSEMLTLLLDGELNGADEEILFKTLAGNEELRAELGEMLAVREAVKKDVEAFAPPAAAKANIYQSLGLGEQSKPVAPPILARFNWVKKIWAPALAAVLAALFTTALLNENFENRMESARKSFEASSPAQIADVEQTAPTKITGDKPSDKQTLVATIANKPDNRKNDALLAENISVSSERQSSAPKKENPILASVENQSRVSKSNNFFAEDFPHSNIAKNETSAIDFSETPLKPASATLPKFVANSGSGDASIEFRYLKTFSQPESSLPQSGAMFSNFNVGLYLFSWGENLKLGFVGGAEEFGILVDDELQYENIPTEYWGGVAAKYRFADFEIARASIYPYAQLALGASGVGPLGKVLGGVQYDGLEYISLNFGIEHTFYLYQKQSKLYNKTGLIIGTSVKF